MISSVRVFFACAFHGQQGLPLQCEKTRKAVLPYSLFAGLIDRKLNEIPVRVPNVNGFDSTTRTRPVY